MSGGGGLLLVGALKRAVLRALCCLNRSFRPRLLVDSVPMWSKLTFACLAVLLACLSTFHCARADGFSDRFYRTAYGNIELSARFLADLAAPGACWVQTSDQGPCSRPNITPQSRPSCFRECVLPDDYIAKLREQGGLENSSQRTGFGDTLSDRLVLTTADGLRTTGLANVTTSFVLASRFGLLADTFQPPTAAALIIGSGSRGAILFEYEDDGKLVESGIFLRSEGLTFVEGIILTRPGIITPVGCDIQARGTRDERQRGPRSLEEVADCVRSIPESQRTGITLDQLVALCQAY